MLKRALPLAALICLALALPAWAAGDCDQNQNTLTVNGTASVSQPPELVELTLGVTTFDASAQKAAQANAAAMQAIIAALKKAMGNEGSLTTTGYRVNTRYNRNRTSGAPVFEGFEVTNRVSLTSPAVNQVGALLDAGTRAGANQVSGPNWRLKEPQAAVSQAQVAAVKDAQQKAQALAAAAGRKLGPILVIDAAGGGGPRPVLGRMMAAEAAPPTPVEPGSLETSASVTVVFRLVP